MTKETLQQIIDENINGATRGDLFAISKVVHAQEELKKINKLENERAFAEIISEEINWEKGYCGNHQ